MQHNNSSLMISVKHGRSKVFSLLLKAGANTDMQDSVCVNLQLILTVFFNMNTIATVNITWYHGVHIYQSIGRHSM